LDRASAMSPSDSDAVRPPAPLKGWRIRTLWKQADLDCSCRFLDAFVVQEMEVNQLPMMSSVTIREGASHTPNETRWRVGARAMLDSIRREAAESKRENVYSVDLTCDIGPTSAAASHVENVRSSLRSILPSPTMRNAVLASLGHDSHVALDGHRARASTGNESFGTDASFQSQQAFSSPLMRTMLSAWSSSSVRRDHNRLQLEKRAQALMNGMPTGDAPDRHKDSSHTRYSGLSPRIGELFAGCPENPGAYLRTYPELAVLVAALLSADTCVSGLSSAGA
jgi:hypothetical protein